MLRGEVGAIILSSNYFAFEDFWNLVNNRIVQEFDDPRDADDAVYDLNGKELAGERVTLEFSKRGPRGRGGGGGGGGGRFDDRYGGPPRRGDR